MNKMNGRKGLLDKDAEKTLCNELNVGKRIQLSQQQFMNRYIELKKERALRRGRVIAHITGVSRNYFKNFEDKHNILSIYSERTSDAREDVCSD